MTKIFQSLSLFAASLEQGQIVTCNKRGEWKAHGKFFKNIKQIFHPNKEDDTVLLAFQRVLSDAEKSKLFFYTTPVESKKQIQFYQDLLRAGTAVVESYSSSQNERIQALRSSLQLGLLSMQYRIQRENGGLRKLDAREIDPAQFDQLQEAVNKWQKSDERYEHVQPINFSARLVEICQYPEIVRYLLDAKNKSQATKYIQMALKDNFDISVLSEYYYESQTLADCVMTKRIGAVARKILSIDLVPTQAGTTQKVLNLLMENKPINLLDKKQKIRFSNGINFKLSQIYHDFRVKRTIPGDFEIMNDGIVPFNGHELAPRIVKKENFLQRLFSKEKYAFIDTSQPGWYEKTPVLDIRSREYLEAHYNVKLESGQWLAVLEATRINELDVDKAHGYGVFFQPIDDNNYRVYSFGAFPLKFPQNDFELTGFVGNTVKGTVAFDPNYYYSQSQKASLPVVVNEEVARRLLEELGLRRKAGIIFQLGWENCAFFMRNVFIKVFKEMNVPVEIPNFFQKKFLNTRSQGALKYVQRVFKDISKEMMPFIKLLVAIFFRAMRSKIVLENGQKVRKSLWKSPFFDVLKINIPSALHYRIKQDRLAKANDPNHKEKYANCVLNYGHRPNVIARASAAAA